MTALGFKPIMDLIELNQERDKLLEWVAKNPPRWTAQAGPKGPEGARTGEPENATYPGAGYGSNRSCTSTRPAEQRSICAGEGFFPKFEKLDEA